MKLLSHMFFEKYNITGFRALWNDIVELLRTAIPILWQLVFIK